MKSFFYYTPLKLSFAEFAAAVMVVASDTKVDTCSCNEHVSVCLWGKKEMADICLFCPSNHNRVICFLHAWDDMDPPLAKKKEIHRYGQHYLPYCVFASLRVHVCMQGFIPFLHPFSSFHRDSGFIFCSSFDLSCLLLPLKVYIVAFSLSLPPDRKWHHLRSPISSSSHVNHLYILSIFARPSSSTQTETRARSYNVRIPPLRESQLLRAQSGFQ